MIKVSGHGNAVADPEVRYTSSGKPVCTVRVAAWNGKDKSLFIDLEAWDDFAENLASSVRKGTRLVWSGTLREDEWQNKDGETRRKVKISVSEVGPSLQWATAKVTKIRADESDTGRREAVERGRERVDDARSAQQTAFADDEEPF